MVSYDYLLTHVMPQCDETKPACLRCLKSKTQCAYRDQVDLNFRNQTDSTAKSAQNKWRQRARQHIALDAKSSESETDSQADQSSESSDVTESIQKLSLVNARQKNLYLSQYWYPANTRPETYVPRKIDPPLEATAIGLLFSDYIIVPKSIDSGGFFNFLPNMYTKSSPNSVLRSTVNTMALANLANKHDIRDLRTAATAGYCQTLKLLNTTLQSPSNAVLDETLLTTVLLMMYEVHIILIFLLYESRSIHQKSMVA